jgi:hypothetical protein
MPTITIRLNNLPECCRQCLERCPECVLRAELWRQATWQLSRAIPPSPRYVVECRLESQGPTLAQAPREQLGPIKETIMHRAQGARRSKKSRTG